MSDAEVTTGTSDRPTSDSGDYEPDDFCASNDGSDEPVAPGGAVRTLEDEALVYDPDLDEWDTDEIIDSAEAWGRAWLYDATDSPPDTPGETVVTSISRPPHAQPPPGYRQAHETAPKVGPSGRPARRSWASPTRLLTMADLHVGHFARRPEIILDLPDALAACIHLMAQCTPMALDRMNADDADRGVRHDISSLTYGLREEFGPHLEATMAQFADLVLTDWYSQRLAR